MPTISEIQGRLRGRIQEIIGRVRARVPMMGQVGGGQLGQLQIGRGTLIEQARSVLTRVSTRAEELRPGILPKVAEFKPGMLVGRVFGQYGVSERGPIAVSEPPEIGKKEFRRGISIET